MKPKTRFHFQRPSLTLAITLVLSHLPQAHAADGTWTTDGDGIWSASTNWSGGTIANGVGSTADFSTIGDNYYRTVFLDSARTVGNLTFGSSWENYSSWTLNNNGNPGNVLTLAVGSGAPTIAVNGASATISANIAGTAGFTKTGYGSTLVLSGQNTYTGTTTISQGTLAIEGSGTLGNNANLTIDADTPLGTGGDLFLGGTTQTVGAVTVNGTGDKIRSGNLIATSYAVDNSGVDGLGNSGYSSFISAGLGGLGAGFRDRKSVV